MRKLVLLWVLTLLLSIPVFGEKRNVYIATSRKDHDVKLSQIQRSPMRLSIEVTFDEESRMVEIIGEEYLDGEVFLYDEEENTIGYSSSLDCTLQVPEYVSGSVAIYIDAENWTASGMIDL